ncbi:MAG TPA: DUF3472 domain-containing protein [Bacteroidales bacterium]|nr:DUF3472 domain-containing protein [Bacteroidales bacterium]HPT11091.1 DUF3472 domain-containing protein [Bacteroidales bacterium]
MNIAGKIFLILILITFPSCKGVSDQPANIKIDISPSHEVIVDQKGEEISFSIVVTPSSVNLLYAYSVSWIKQVETETTKWTVEANTADISRKGKIFILNAETLEKLDTINIIQKSSTGGINEDPDLVFTEADVPVKIPYAGNSYVTSTDYSDFIDNYTGLFSSLWNDNEIVTSTFFRVGAAGNLNLAFYGCNATGTSRIRFTVDGHSYDVIVSGPGNKIYPIAKLTREKEGYVRVDMQGISKSGTSFGDISYFRIGGTAASGTNNYVTEEKMNEAVNNTYFFRRGSSVHDFYTLPESNVEYFYNEVLVTPENAINGTYFMMNGFNEGYMGIQQTSSGERKVLFSVWSPYSTDNPGDIPDDYKVTLLRKGANVTIGDFGGEGSGGQSWLNYSWSPGTTYKALVGAKPDGAGNTIYTAYFFADGEWKLIASFKRPKTNTYYKGAYSFLENFDPTQSYKKRSVCYKNQWVCLASGIWKEVTEAKFSCDDTGRLGLRYDIYGQTNTDKDGFILQSFGFFDEHTVYGTKFQRQPSVSGAPSVDFNALENIPSVK